MKLLEITNLTYRYGKEKVLSNLHYSFEPGQFYAIIGKSGSGKSSLLSLLAGLDKPSSGQVLFQGVDISQEGYRRHRKNNISLVFQNYNLIDYLTPLENVRLVNKQASSQILLDLGLSQDQVNRNVLKLSGGQQQRVAIGRALASEAPVILADEPTGNLDEGTATDIISLFKDLAHDRKKCVIVVTHSKAVAQAADHILELKDKKLYQSKSLVQEV